MAMGTIGIISGTGAAGSGLGLWLARGGSNVVLGSREVARAGEVVETLVASEPEMAGSLRGADNSDAAGADIVILATPWSSLLDVLRPIADCLTDKLVVSMVNPLMRTGGEFVSVGTPSGSAALSVAHWLPRSRVAAAFHHVPAALYHRNGNDFVVDVLVAVNASQDFLELQSAMSEVSSLNLWHAGDLAASATLEQLTPMMLNLNTRYDMLSLMRIVDYRQRVIDLSATVEV